MSSLSDHSDDDSSDNRLYSSDSSEASSIEDSSVSSELSDDHDTFYSASEEFFPYNSYDDNVESVEPIATEQEVVVYAIKLALEEEEEETLWSQFSGEENTEDWQVVIFVIEYIVCVFPPAYVDIIRY